MTAEFKVKVYYEDTDAGGVVYYANYLKYIERARTEILQINGVKQRHLLLENGVAFVVKNVNADYISPARLDDELLVQTRLQNIKPASINLKQDILRGDEVIFTAEVKIAAIKMQGFKPTKIPSSIKQVFEQLTA